MVANFENAYPGAHGVGSSVAGRNIGASTIIGSARYIELDKRESYGNGSQHDAKFYDFDGRIINSGPMQMQPFLTEQAAFNIPMKMRRPSAPTGLGRMINDAFTSLLFGEDTFPNVVVAGDEDTQDFKNTLAKVAKLRTKMIRARNVGGAVGTVALSWCFRNGRPRVEVHNAKHVWVQEWQDRAELVPAWATEIYPYHLDVFNAAKRRYERRSYWYRRDWTLDEEVLFKPVPFENGKEPDWTQFVDVAQSVPHGENVCHLVWIQNLPSDEVDGMPDFHGLYDALDSLDIVNSVLVRGTVLNLDPTLVVKAEDDVRAHGSVKKGSDNSIWPGPAGDAKYLELSGSSVQAGKELFGMMRKSILDAAHCVVPNPDEVAASGTSSVAMKVIYRPMLARGSVLREQYGGGIERLLDAMTQVATAKMSTPVPVVDGEGKETGESAQYLDLPPRIEQKPKLDEDGNPTGETTTTTTERAPGDGGETTLDWGAWFPLTPQDKAAEVAALSQACGAQPFMSPQTAAEEAAAIYDRDPHEEAKRVADAAKQQREHDLNKFGGGFDQGAGGQVGNKDQPPPGAKPRPGKAPPFGAKKDPDDPAADDDEDK